MPPLPATAETVRDADTFKAAVSALTTAIIKAVHDGKSVTSVNKKIICAAAEEIRRSAHAFTAVSSGAPRAPEPLGDLHTDGAAGGSAAPASEPVGAAVAAAAPTTTVNIEGLRRELHTCTEEVRRLRDELASAAPPITQKQITKRIREEVGKLKVSAATAGTDEQTDPPTYAHMALRRLPQRGAAQQQQQLQHVDASLGSAQAVASRPAIVAATKPPDNSCRPAIIVSTKSPVQSRQEAVSAFREAISFKQSTYAPVGVRPLSKSKLRVEFETSEQRDETLDRLRDSGKVTAEPARKTRPLFILKGITKEVTAEELVQVLKCQNPGVGDPDRDGDVEIRFLRNNRKPNLYNAVLSAEPAAWRKAIELERVNIDHQKVRVHEFTPFIQCRVCLQFGHTSKNCGEGAPATCAYCAGAGHNQTECPDREKKAPPKCCNCVQRNQKFSNRGEVAHMASSSSCPILRAVRKRVESNIDYGV